MPDLRRMVRTASIDRSLLSPKRLAGYGAKALFWVLLALLVVVAASEASPILVVLAAGLLASQMIYVFFPKGRVRSAFARLYTGEAGEEAYDETTEFTKERSSSFMERFR